MKIFDQMWCMIAMVVLCICSSLMNINSCIVYYSHDNFGRALETGLLAVLTLACSVFWCLKIFFIDLEDK